jgi:hypothetical protein
LRGLEFLLGRAMAYELVDDVTGQLQGLCGLIGACL